jgi:toxin-antitoxin system PIN domain toxin
MTAWTSDILRIQRRPGGQRNVGTRETGDRVILTDVNVLIYAFREDAPNHARYRKWLESRLASHEPFGLSDVVLSGVIRVLTHPAVFRPATPLNLALEYCEALRAYPNTVEVSPGPRHWEIFASLCRTGRARGNHVPDAWLAALALEHGCEWVTSDRGFSRFTALRTIHPLD